MRANIIKLYLINFLTGLVFWYAVEKLFMYSIGINAFGVSINAVVLVIVSTLFDVPFGVLADRWSRKYTLAIGIGMLGLSSLVYGVSHNLLVYMFGSVLYGFYLCATSGTFQAITYDTLQEHGRADLYAKHQGGSYGVFLASIAISSPLGGLLSHAYGYRSVFLWSAALCIVTLCLVLSMHEPGFHKQSRDTKLSKHIGGTTRLLINNRTLLYISSIILICGLLRNTLNEYAGLYFIAIGFGAIGSGWANGGKWIFGSLGQFAATRLARYLPYALVIFFIAFAVMSSWRTPLGLIFLYLCTFTHGIIQNESQALLQHHITSDLRATALSVVNFGTNALAIPLGLGFGWLAQHKSVFAAYQLFAIIGLLYLVIWLVWQRKIRLQPVNVASPARAERT